MQGINSLILACKYCFAPNQLGYCGPSGAHREFLDFIESPSAEEEKKIKGLFRRFYALYPYLALIAEKNNLQAFDEKAVEAYWLGSRLLNKVKENDIKNLILHEFSKPGLLPKNIAAKKAENLPKGIKLNHSFHVLYINSIAPKPAPLVNNLDKCLISWGKVEKPQKRNFLVKGTKLIFENNEFKLLEKRKKIAKGFVENVKRKDFVAVHWNKAVELLDEEKLDNLINYTGKNLRAVNSVFR